MMEETWALVSLLSYEMLFKQKELFLCYKQITVPAYSIYANTILLKLTFLYSILRFFERLNAK